jgi:Holliday junction resolvase-like predicted endonuclease
MSLMGEQLAEEWLNRRGYFTIRGAKIGTGEIDLLAVRCRGKTADCWHYEVQASLRPISYLTPASHAERKQGVAAFSAKQRTREQLQRSVAEWV